MYHGRFSHTKGAEGLNATFGATPRTRNMPAETKVPLPASAHRRVRELNGTDLMTGATRRFRSSGTRA